MFGLSKRHAGEIGLDTFANLPADAWELARFWVSSEKSFVSVARQERWSPELLGSLLVECVYTAAAGYASSGRMSENEALQRIWSGVDQERDRLNSQELN
jgi:hypothetical protein